MLLCCPRGLLSKTTWTNAVLANATSAPSTLRPGYVLYYKPNIPLALIEAKDNNHSVGDRIKVWRRGYAMFIAAIGMVTLALRFGHVLLTA